MYMFYVFGHPMWLSIKAPNVAYVSFLSVAVYQIGALIMAQYAPPSLVHDDVQE